MLTFRDRDVNNRARMTQGVIRFAGMPAAILAGAH